ncbi:Uncharacterized membrane protein YckC, RDD family [Granulicella rosea]|uniref:Uncharacterized membrane protein YckC, RDD family n=1 Tax=Granulicella rosea TaxID=474952 RepID=A0A239LP67_9BACT|nr:RDD family protein [Granulicella rosea]SNT31479.1 Uncharacterized membrane protein YckC, RDD family [Granulicella rosea]
MSSAQLDILPSEYEAADLRSDRSDSPVEVLDGGAANALRQQAAATLAAHRERRTRSQAAARLAAAPVQTKARPTNSAAAAVAARFAQSPSYRAVLAEEARRAIEQAAAAAEVATRSAEAVVAAQRQILDELQKWEAPQEFKPGPQAVVPAAAPAPRLVTTEAEQPKPSEFEPLALSPVDLTPITPAPARSEVVKERSSAGLTVRLYEDVGLKQVPFKDNALVHRVDPEETEALDEEIAFRQSPVFEPIEPPAPLEEIPANLLEFPRQLVATRKARPRLAEGPLREDADAFEAEQSAQLRIFEVEADQPAPAAAQDLQPIWSAIWLDAISTPPAAYDSEPEYERTLATRAEDLLPSLVPPDTASIPHRLMAATVDAALVLGGFIAFGTAFAVACGPTLELPGVVPTAIAAVATLAVFHILYHLLFFTFSDATPGMRYARIGLCTFTDENPTRKAMRKRVFTTLIAAAPLGLGLIWAALDDDGLGWHDRMSRMYQRGY